MPTYEYLCTSCANRFEIFQRIGDEPLQICDVCGGELRKVFHPAGIVFKGSGFYSTDSRKAASAADGGKKREGERAEARAPRTGKAGAGTGEGGKGEGSTGGGSTGEGGTSGAAGKKEAS